MHVWEHTRSHVSPRIDENRFRCSLEWIRTHSRVIREALQWWFVINLPYAEIPPWHAATDLLKRISRRAVDLIDPRPSPAVDRESTARRSTAQSWALWAPE